MVKTNDMYYAWSSDDKILENGECGGAITSFLKYLLEENIVDGVLSVKKGSDLYDAVPTFITNPDEIIDTAGSLHCGTLNMANNLRNYLNGSKDKKIAVTVKPCDAMSIIELMKRNQIDKDNVLLVGINCGGTMPPVKAREMVEKFYEIDPDDVVKEEIAKGNLIIETKDGEKEISIDELEDEDYGRRSNCRRCDVNIPRMADLAFGNWGVIGSKAGEATFVEIFSDKGAEYFGSAINKGALNVKDPDKKGIEIRDNIDKIMTKLSKKWQKKDFNKEEGDLLTIENYMDQLNKCIKCFGCRESCPLCFCKDCSLESESPNWVDKGVLPPSPMFHWVRLLHVVDSCTNCGQCEEICPMEIPLSRIYHSINVQLQEKFGYHPGMDVNQKPPLSIIDKEASEE